MKKIILFFLLGLPLLASAQNAKPVVALKGIDVSKYQRTIDWQRVADKNNLSFAYIRATEGGTITDSLFDINISGARKAGMKVGCYHVYSRHSSAQSQFDHFKSVVAGKGMELVPVVDIEPEKNIELNVARVDRLLQLFEQEYGVKPIIYTTMSMYQKYFNLERYAAYHVFIACYDLKFPDTRYTLWQYTNREKVDGILGYVDGIKLHPTYKLSDITL